VSVQRATTRRSPPHVLLATVVTALVLVTAVPPATASDGDSDKVEDEFDNCIGAANPLQFDADGDGEGDVCERPFPTADAFDGTDGIDLMFGTFQTSVLRGGPSGDSLYGEGGDDLIDGGPGRDMLAGGPGDDVITGGAACDLFGIETAIEQRDVFTDFSPLIDRVRFPPRARERGLNRLPLVESGGTEHLEVTFIIEEFASAVVVFEGFAPGTRLVLSTQPCDESPPPASICPKPLAHREFVFVGFDNLFCPGGGELWANTGVYSSARFGVAAHKTLGERLTVSELSP
jgi:Ca2+-binding RTX toxin-like protein